MTFALCHIKGEPQTLIKIVACTMHDFGIGLLWAQVTQSCVKVTNDTFKVMKQHNYIIMMVTEVVTWCVSYLQLKVTNQQHTMSYFETMKVVTHV